MPRLIVTSILAAALCAALVVAPAFAGKKKPKAKPPEVKSTEYALADQPGAVIVGATVARAERVVAVVGTGAASHRLELVPADQNKTTLWTAQETKGLETCLPVKFVATGPGGADIYREDSCVFGLPDPLPPTPSLPFIGLG
jgi:hypothetical protein